LARKKKSDDRPEPKTKRRGVKRLMESSEVAAITKLYGNVLRAGNEAPKITRICSGIAPMDKHLGGGWAKGYFHTLFGKKSCGKTTTLFRTYGMAQLTCRTCGQLTVLDPGNCACGKKSFDPHVCAHIRLEEWDPEWAGRFCDISEIALAEPVYAEEALDIAEGLVLSGEVDVIGIDSIAFLTPVKEIQDSVAKENQALQSRALGRGIRKINSAITVRRREDGQPPTVFLTNQIRMKLGVMFGCFHSQTPVMFADGSVVPIVEVVRRRLTGPVLSWDGERIVERPIVDWYENGKLSEDERWLTFRVDGSGGRRGAHGFTCTENHLLIGGGGQEVRASEVRPGDTLLSWYEASLSPTVRRIPIEVKVRSIHLSKKKHRDRRKFDLKIEGDSFYLVGGDSRGIVVHNSPEVQPGGQAPQFAAGTEVRFGYAEYKQEKGDDEAPVYADFHYRIEKNKTSVAKYEGTFRMLTANGEHKKMGEIADESWLLDQCEKVGLLTGAGASYTIFGEKYAGKKPILLKMMTDRRYYWEVYDTLFELFDRLGEATDTTNTTTSSDQNEDDLDMNAPPDA
jgi:RecA/RadA recombinase